MPEQTTQPGAGGTPAAAQPGTQPSGTPAGAGGTPGQGGNQAAALTFETWLGSQDETAKTLINAHVSGLKTALETEREQRKTFQQQVKELAAKQPKDSEGRASLEELATQLSKAQQQTAFYDAAAAAGVKNLRLAWLAAQEAQLVDEKGGADFGKLRAQFGELFQAAALTNPGANSRGAALTATSGDKLICLETARFMQADGKIYLDYATSMAGVAKAYALPAV